MKRHHGNTILLLTVLSLGLSTAHASITEDDYEAAATLHLSKAAFRGGLSFSHFPLERLGYHLEWESGFTDVYPKDSSQDIPSYTTHTMRGGLLVTLAEKMLDRPRGFSKLKLDASVGASHSSWNLMYSGEPNRRTGGLFVGVYPKAITPGGLIMGGDFKIEKEPDGWKPRFAVRIGYKF
jgi:hypothetical protein